MINIKLEVNGEIIYGDNIEDYNYSIPRLIKNGAIKIIIEYPNCKVILEPKE